MSELYPLKFEPILKEKIWGGNSLATLYGKDQGKLGNIGESWEISAVSGDLSTVTNGFLAGNNIEEIIEVYMGDITGESVYEKFGNEFPLLIKLIEARDDLSVQVHPGNELARERHNAYGKTEMWYILQSEKNSKIYTGFLKPVTSDIYKNALDNDNLPGLLNSEHPEAGDTFFTPSGRIHAIGAGVVLAEIQQTSDITYRIYDWGRTDSKGIPRELHTELAIDTIDFEAWGENKIRKDVRMNQPETLVGCEFFTTNLIRFDKRVERDFNMLDTFTIYICTEGGFEIRWDGKSEPVVKGQTVLIPAVIADITLVPQPVAETLEIYIDNNNMTNL